MGTRLLFVGGEDQHLRIPFMRALRDRGFRLMIAGSGNPYPFARDGFSFRPLSFERFIHPIADCLALRRTAELLKDTRPDIVHSFDTKPNLLVPLAARGISDLSVVRTINGLGWLYSSRSPVARTLRPLYRTLHRAAARSTAATVFQNRDDQTHFELNKMVGRGGGRLIPGSGIEVEGFERTAAAGPSPAALRHELGLGSSEVVITVSRVTHQKGIPTLLAAAALVHAVRPSVRFLLVGPRDSEGPGAVAQAKIDRHAPYVLAIGPRIDVPALLRMADIFAFPTEYREGIPRALLEAALSRLPIITTEMPGCRDIVRNGETGMLIPPRSPERLAAAILDLLRDRNTARAMGARAAELVKDEFELGLTVERYVAVYEELLARSARTPHRSDEERAAASTSPFGSEIEATAVHAIGEKQR